jgi:hypothetical protein
VVEAEALSEGFECGLLTTDKAVSGYDDRLVETADGIFGKNLGKNMMRRGRRVKNERKEFA